MVQAPDAIRLDHAEREADAAVRTGPVDEPEAPAAVAEQHEVLAEQAHLLRAQRVAVELGDGAIGCQ